MSNIAEQIGVKTKLLLKWSSRYAWVMRTDAYDNHLSAIKQDMVKQALMVKFEAEARATADTICKAKTIVMHDLDVLVKRASDPEMEGELLLNHKTMVQLLDRVVMLERIVTGQSTSKAVSESRVDRTERTVKHVIVDDNRRRDPRTITMDPVNGSESDEDLALATADGGTDDGGVVDGSGTPPLSGPMRTVRRGASAKHA